MNLNKLLPLTGALLLCALLGQAAPVLTLDPATGIIDGQPGRVTGWGFSLTSDNTYWLSVIGVVVLDETNPALGLFTDFIGPQGGPSAGALAPGAADWTQAFNATLALGFGSYAIDPAAGFGDRNSGTFLLLYELFSDDPNVCGGCYVDSGMVTAAFGVNAVPEPGTWALAGVGLTVVLARRSRRLR